MFFKILKSKLLLLFLINIFLPVQLYPINSSSIETNLSSISNNLRGFSEPILLTTNDTDFPVHVEPTIAISDNDTIFVGYKNALDHNTGGVGVGFTKSNDFGKSWSEPINMDDFIPESSKSDPWMIWNNEVLYYSYLEFRYYTATDFDSQMTLARSNNFGTSWNITKASSNDHFADKETFIVDNNRIYLVYDDVGRVPEVPGAFATLNVIDTNGSIINDIVFSDNNTKENMAPVVGMSNNGTLITVWFQYMWEGDIAKGALFTDRATKDNLTFGIDRMIPNTNYSTFTLSEDGRVSKLTLPMMKMDSNDRVYLMFADTSEPNNSWDSYIMYSDDYGLSWSKKYMINPEIVGNQWMPNFVIDSKNNIHAIYYDEATFNDQLWHYSPYYQVLRFVDNNLVSSPPIEITGQKTSSEFTRPGDYISICLDSKEIPHIVWTDGYWSELDIYYSHGLIETEGSSKSSINSSATESSSAIASINNNSIIIFGVLFIYFIRNNRKKI